MDQTVVQVHWSVAEKYPDSIALMYKNRKGDWESVPFREFARLYERFGAGMLDFGVERGDHVGIISDNRKEWIIANLGILGLGAADVPRGSDTMPEEVGYILRHSDCTVVLAENADQLRKILSHKKQLPNLKTVIVIDDAFKPGTFKDPTFRVKLLRFADIMERGKKLLTKDPDAWQREMRKGKPSDLATLIYTSGTTGEPKGVMLTHGNFLHNLRTIPAAIEVGPGDLFLSVLPVWHSFERIIENFALSRGATMAYSKPIGKIMMADMAAVKPTVMGSIPRLWEVVRAAIYRKVNEEGGVKKLLFRFFVAVGKAHATATALVRGLYPQFTRRYRVLDFIMGILPFVLLYPVRALGNLLVFAKVKQQLGGRFRFTVSGGGALPPYVDKFFGAAGVLLLEGYGLTETTPVVSVRLQKHPVPGTIGPLLPEQQMKLIDQETGAEVGPGKKGVIYLKGPNVMKGYYKRPKITAEVLSADGWLNTGDLGMVTHQGEIRIIGRTKETIVLLGGENVEPAPIEDTILESDYIDQVMVIGQDQKFLGALVVPNQEALEKYAKGRGLSWAKMDDLFDHPQVLDLITDEIQERVSAKRGFRGFERVFRFKMIPKHFEPGVELSGNLKMKRNVISEIYKRQISEVFAK